MNTSTLNFNKIKIAGVSLLLALGMAVTPAISYAAHDGDHDRGKVKQHHSHASNFKVRDKYRDRNNGREVVIVHNNGRYHNNRIHKHYRDRRYFGHHHDRVRTVVIKEPVYREIYTDYYDDPRISIGLRTGHFDLYFEN
jgi:hypothetical protein